MNIKSIRFFLGHLLWIEAAFMLPALLISLHYREMETVCAFLYTMGLMAIFIPLLLLKTRGERKVYARDGLVIVSLSWIVLSIFGALPFVFSGCIPRFVDALFETISGFTTTGATVLTDVEALPRGVLYWRSFTHWLGGMGVLVFLLIIVPNGGRGRGDLLHVLRGKPRTCRRQARSQASSEREDTIHNIFRTDSSGNHSPVPWRYACVRLPRSCPRHGRHRRLFHKKRQHRLL